jgi:hypothetical protein
MAEDREHQETDGESVINVQERQPGEYEGTCLRPLGLCELGGCCDVCWYRPDHPRFKASGSD